MPGCHAAKMKLTVDNDVLLSEVCSSLAHGKKVKLRARGDSMRPFIRGGEDILVISPVAGLQRGDIILAKISGNRYVVHRIISIKSGRIVMMGDGNLYSREECGISDVYGIVGSVVRCGKEHSLISYRARIYADMWRMILPLRRLYALIRRNMTTKTGSA